MTVIHADDCAVEEGRCTCTPEIVRRVGVALATIDPAGVVTEHLAQ